MPKFGPESVRKLRTCDERLQRVLNEVIKDFDMTVIEGHRGEAAQNKAFEEKRSKLRWPNGNHNSYPSTAVDVAPYPVDYGETGSDADKRLAIQKFFYMAGLIMATAKAMGIKLRWGGNWNGGELSKQSFNDLPHFEVLD